MLIPTLLLGAVLGSQTEGERALNAHRLTPTTGAPTLDGRLDDAVWLASDSISGFVQRDPDEGAPSRFPTVVRVAFDDEAVYVALRAYDPEPRRIMAPLTRRDEDSPSDWLLVGFDSRHDLRTAYVFAVNPAGVKRDFIVADGQDDDASWDAVWEAEVRRDPQGWTAELKIPLSALRFAEGGDGVWGFQVARVVKRANEESYWAPMKKDDSRVVARFGELRGLSGLPAPRRLELLPYTVSGVTRAPRGVAGDPFYARNDLRGAFGLDLKYGLTSDLTLDATVNPDFGQVEADPSEVNLSAYETFYAEKRPFFTEGADIFRFGIGLGDGDGGNESLFYSRRIGRRPHDSYESDDERWVSQPGQTTILGAAKLSGRVGGGWSVGALGALTGEETARFRSPDGGRWEETVEPMTGFGVLRARRDLNGGRTQVGGVGTGVVRRLEGTEMAWLPTSAFTGGADFQHRWGNDTWRASGFVLGSHVRGDPEAMVALQTSSARYFQRPDAGHVEVDSAATSLSGWSVSYDVGKVKGRWRGGVVGSYRSPGFETNDLGFMRDADQVLNVGWLSYNETRPGKLFREYDFNLNAWAAQTTGWERVGTAANVNGYAQFLSYWGVYGGAEHALSSISTGALRGGPSVYRPAATNGWMGFHSDSRKPLEGGADFSWRREAQTGTWRYGASVNLAWQASPSTRLSVSPFYSRSFGGWQYVDQVADTVTAGLTHYVFGELDQRTAGMSARVSQTFSPTLSLQLYAQPYISDGAFDRFKEVGDARSSDFSERFLPLAADPAGFAYDDPDFNFRAVNLNAVLRWEYRLGSTIYVAWSHAREGYADEATGRFRPRHDFDALANLPATDVLLVKMNWWVNF
ncbi:MAG TPA: DUF5916 domain-containing protein [Longimicrobium sp.]|nr:DUF5916 domain-containing protein [Longimicrobium sp.]